MPPSEDSARSIERPSGGPQATLLEALAGQTPTRTVELRPPRRELTGPGSVDAWIDVNRSVRGLLDAGRFVLFTDAAVGALEEESLQHLRANLGQHADLSRIVPFLTCKHTLDYCLLFAQRAEAVGIGAITVAGGDQGVGPPRCVPRSRDLRRLIRDETPGVRLGAWVNPYKDPVEQIELLLDPEHYAEYYVTQVVSHHWLEPVDRFLNEAAKRGLTMPGLVGVFFYRSASERTFDRLEAFIPVPRGELATEFASGASAEEVCARTLRALTGRGIEKTYISNLGTRAVCRQLEEIEARS